jgi:hypothetical protein
LRRPRGISHPPGARPLDQEPPAPDPARTATPPGLRRQAAQTKDALRGVVRAHVDLAKAEADEIKGEVGRAAALGGAALACLLLLGILFPVGSILFAGEWLFGSIGWGLLHGTLFLVAVAVTMGLLALRVAGLGIDVVAAAVIGLVLAIVFAFNLPNELWRRLGDAANLGDPSWRPLATGAVVLAVIGGLAGLAGGLRAGGGGAIAGGLIGGLIVGAVLGAFTAITFGGQAGAAVGVTAGLIAWPTLMGVRVARQGIDTEALKARFWPQATIDTTRETIEWAKARNPLGPRS